MKNLLFIIGIGCLSSLASAQDSSGIGATAYTPQSNKKVTVDNPTLDKSFIWSIGIEPSIPVGHFDSYAKFGFGVSLQGELKTSKSIGLTINAGYIAYAGRTVDTVSYPSFKYWPVMGGLKAYMGKTYVHGQAGAGFGSSGLGTSFWYGAGLGMNFTKRIDAEFRYMGWKQEHVNKSSGGSSGGVYGGTGGTGGSGGGYGGHYSTLGLRLAVNF